MLSSQEAAAELKIDPEFQGLIPMLSRQELEGLERSLCEEGCRDPIVAWEGIIVDGHHRHQLCRKHKIPFKVVEKDFQNRDDAKIWIIKNQFARRNVTDFTRCVLALEVEPLLAAQARERQREGGRHKLPQKHAPPHSESGETRDVVARLAGVSHDTIRKAKLILDKASEEEKAELSRSDARLTIHALYLRLRQEQLRTGTPIFPDGMFGLIYCDPPWRFAITEFENRAVENHYPTLGLDELVALPVSSIAADDCVLFMWCPAAKLEEALQLVNRWGFAYRSGAVWVKNSIGMGYYFRNAHEHLLIATKGSPPTPRPGDRLSSIISGARSGHSHKPEQVYDMIEHMYPYLTKVELFATQRRKGWTAWGNQVAQVSQSAHSQVEVTASVS
jgi:N6-adenosine-specific RNA methylase IME4